MKRFASLAAVLLLSVLVTGANAQPIEEWVARYSSTSNDEPYGVAVDHMGNVYVTGYTIGHGNDYLTIKYDPEGNELWRAQYDGPSQKSDKATAIAVDDSGNVYVTGSSYSSDRYDDFATIKYNTSGVQQWVAVYSLGSYDKATAITVDASGYVYVTGYGEQATGDNYITVKYSPTGAQQWASIYNGPYGGYGTDRAYDVAVDASGNVYVTGFSRSTGSDYDYATVKYNASGTQQWAKRYNSSGTADDTAYALTLDASGYIYVTGTGGGYCSTIKYSASGSSQWLSRYTVSQSEAYDIAVDGAGNVFITGYSSGTDQDYLTVKYNSEGVQQWASNYTGTGGNDQAKALALDDSSNVYVTGYSGGVGTGDDYATLKYNSSGTQEWVIRYNGTGNDIANDVAVDAARNVYVTGSSVFPSCYKDYITIKYAEGAAMDVGPISIDAPPDSVWSGYSCTPQATVANFEADTVSFPIVCEFDSAGSVVYSDTVLINDLAGTDSIEVSFADWIPGEGDYVMTVTTLLEGDGNPGNDQLAKTVTALEPPRDVAVISINAPEDTVWSAHSYVPQATVANLWEEPQTFDVRCEFDSSGTVVYSDTVTVTDLAGGDSTQLSFAEWTAGEDNGLPYTMTVTTLLEDDVNPDNDELSKEVTAIWPPRDVAAVAIVTPPDFVWSGFAHIPRAIVANFWKEPETFDVRCEFDSAGVTIYSEVATVTALTGGDSTLVEFAPWSAGATDEFTYQMIVTTLLAQDLNPANDTVSKLVHSVKAVADVDVQDYAGNLSANTMELVGVPNSIVVGSYIMVNPDELGKNVDLYDGPANVDLALSYSATDLVTYDGRWRIGSDNVDPDLNTVASLALGDAALNIVQVYIPRKHVPSEGTFVGKVTVSGEGEGAADADEFTLKVNVVPGGHGGWHPCSFGGEPLAQGNQLYWTDFGFGEQDFNLYRAKSESEEFTRLNTESMKFTEYLDCDVSVQADYRYKLGLNMGDGREVLIGPLSLTSSPEVGTPVLEQNWPNPWKDATEICYFLPNGVTSATLKVYDISGKLVKTLAQGSHEPGFHSVTWNGKDEYDRSVSSGVYFYILNTENQRQTRKMLLLR